MNIEKYVQYLIEHDGTISPRMQFYVYGGSLLYTIIIIAFLYPGAGPLV